MRIPAVAILLVVLSAMGCSSRDEATRGPIERTVTTTDDAIRMRAVRHEVALAELPDLARTLGVPVAGTVVIDADVTVQIVNGLPDYRTTTGRFALRCTGRCSIGGDDAKLDVGSDRSDTFAGSIHVGRIDIPRLELAAEMKNGRAWISHWVLESADVVVTMDVSTDLGRMLEESQVSGCVRYKASDALRGHDPKTFDLLTMIGGMFGPDGAYHITVEGRADQLKTRAKVCN